MSPFVSLHLSPVVSQPGWTGSFVSLCLPSFVSHCLPAWMPGAALWVDGCICLPLSRRMSDTPLFPFICLPLSPSLDAWHCFLADGFTCLPWFPFICLPSLWVDGFICFPLSPFICLPLSPSLDAWHGSLGGRIHLSPVASQPGCVALTLRGFLHFPRFCPFGGVWFAFGFGPGLVDVGDRVLLCLPFIWTSISLGLVVGRLPCLSLATPCLFVQCLVISCGPELTIAVRCGARVQLREGSVNPPVKQT